MKFKLSKTPPPTGRQRLRDNLGQAQTPYAYRSRRSEPKSPAASKSNSFWLQRFGLLILLLAAILSVINVTRLSGQPKIMALNDNRRQIFLRPSVEYETVAAQLLDASVWNNNKLTIDTSQLSRQMRARFPELASVNVSIPLLAHRPLVHISPASPALVMETPADSYVIDNTGKALAKYNGSAAIKELRLPVLKDQSGLNITLNRQALPSDDMDFIRHILAQLTARNYKVADMSLPSAANQLEVRLVGQPYFIKFNLQGNNPRGQAGTFLATIESLKRKNIVPTQYIDVRVDGRAYYQ